MAMSKGSNNVNANKFATFATYSKCNKTEQEHFQSPCAVSGIQKNFSPTRNSESARRNAPDSVHGGEIRDIKCKTGQPSDHLYIHQTILAYKESRSRIGSTFGILSFTLYLIRSATFLMRVQRGRGPRPGLRPPLPVLSESGAEAVVAAWSCQLHLSASYSVLTRRGRRGQRFVRPSPPSDRRHHPDTVGATSDWFHRLLLSYDRRRRRPPPSAVLW